MHHSEPADRVFWAAPMLLGLLIIFGGTFIGAALLAGGMIAVNLAPLAAYIPLGLGCLLASHWGARRAAAHRLPMGLLIGMLLLSCLALLGLTEQQTAFAFPAAGMTAGIALAASLLGAFFGAAARKKKR